MDWTLEVVVLPVSDIDRSVAFYRDQVGFHLDHDTQNEHMHVVQLTPPGSGCSIVFGDLPSQNEMAPGSVKALQLVVSDAAAARQELSDRGVEVSDLMVLAETRRWDVLRLRRPGRKLIGVRDQGTGRQAAPPQGSHGIERLGGKMSLTKPGRAAPEASGAEVSVGAA